MAETSTIFGFMKYVSATDILSDFKKTVDSHFVNSLTGFWKPVFLYSSFDVYPTFDKVLMSSSVGCCCLDNIVTVLSSVFTLA